MSQFSMMKMTDKENCDNSSNKRFRALRKTNSSSSSSHSSSSSSSSFASSKKKFKKSRSAVPSSVLKKILGRAHTDPVPSYKRKLCDDDEEGLGSNLLSSFSRNSEEPMHTNFKKSTTILQTMTDPATGEHMGFLKEVMGPKAPGAGSPRMTLHQRNVWDDGWLMEVHFTFKNYTEQQITAGLKFIHVHDNLEFFRFGDEQVKVESEKRHVFNVFALEGSVEQFVVRRKQRTGNPRMMEMSYRFGYRQNGRWKMTF